MKRHILSILFVAVWPGLVCAQLTALKDITLPNIQFATTDRAGDLYVVTDNLLQKTDSNGHVINTLPVNSTTHFDTGNSVRLMTYQKGTSQYSILSPSIHQVETAALDPSLVIEPVLLCASGDYNAWALDAGDWSLKKLSLRKATVITEVLIDTSLISPRDIRFMKEYQNLLFVLDEKKGIHLYNMLGKYVRTIPQAGLRYFNFLGEELYYYHNGQVHLVDLFTGEKRSWSFTQGAPAFVVLTGSRLFAINSSGIQVYSFSPTKDLPVRD